MQTNFFAWSKKSLLLAGVWLFFASFFVGGQASAANITWNGSLDHSTFTLGTNWDGNVAPGVNDVAMIGSGADNIVIGASTTVQRIFTGMNFTGSLSLNAGVVVTTTDSLSIGAGTFSVAADNTLNIGGDFGVSSTVNMTGGTVNVAGNMTVTSTLSNSGANLNLYGDLNVVAGGVVNNTVAGTVTMNGGSKNLGGAGSLTLFSLTIASTTNLAGDVTSTGYLTVNSGQTLAGTSHTIHGNLVLNNGTITQTSGTLDLNTNSGYVSGTGDAFLNNLTITNNSSITGSTTVSSTVNVTSGKVLTVSGSGRLNLSGTGTPLVLPTAGSLSATGGTIIYSGATANIASTTYYNLIIDNTTSTLTGSTTVSSVLTINSDKQLVAGTNQLTLSGVGTPFVVNGTFTRNTSTVIYSGVGTTYISPTSTYYNLTINSTDANVTSLTGTVQVSNLFTLNGSFYGASNNLYLTASGTTPFVNNGTFNPGYGRVTYVGDNSIVTAGTYFNLSIAASGVILGGNVTTTNVLQINSAKSLNAGSAVVRLTGADTAFVIDGGTFTASTSEFIFSNTGSVTVTGTTYYKLTLGTGSYVLGNNVTTTNTFTNNGTLTLSSYDLVASGDYANNGTVSGVSHVKKQATGTGLDATSYTSGSGNGTGNSVIVSITDYTANSNGAAADTISVNLTASNYSDTETVTLTETGLATGVFNATIPFYIINSKTNNNGKLDVSGSGNLTLSVYSNGYGVSSLTNSSASYTGSNFSSGGGAGGSAPSVSSPSSAASVSAGAQTTSQNITLSLSATNATQVAISEDPGFAGASWQTYSPTKAFTLSSGAGEKTVYVKFLSATGVATPAYKVSVTLKDGYVFAPNTTAVVTLTAPAAVKFEVSNPDSKVVIAPLKTLVYKPNTTLKYTYSYKNEATKTVKVKVLRQVLDVNGKVVAKATGSVSIAKGKTFKTNVTNVLNSKLADGTYTVKVQIMDFKTGKLLEENSFDITVKKPAPVVKKPVVKAPVTKKK